MLIMQKMLGCRINSFWPDEPGEGAVRCDHPCPRNAVDGIAHPSTWVLESHHLCLPVLAIVQGGTVQAVG
jgi:hypothetical protein